MLDVHAGFSDRTSKPPASPTPAPAPDESGKPAPIVPARPRQHSAKPKPRISSFGKKV